MIKMSLQSIIRLLLLNQYKFSIRECSEFSDCEVIKLVGEETQFETGYYTTTGNRIDVDRLNRDKVSTRDGQLILQYDCQNQRIIGCCSTIKELLSEQKDHIWSPSSTDGTST